MALVGGISASSGSTEWDIENLLCECEVPLEWNVCTAENHGTFGGTFGAFFLLGPG